MHDTAYAFNEPTVLSVNYTPGRAPSHSSHCAKTFPGCPDNGPSHFTQQICKLREHYSIFFFYPLTLSPPLLPALLFVAGNSPRNTLCGVSVNVMHFLLLSPWPPILEEHRHSFCKMLYLKEKKQKKKEPGVFSTCWVNIVRQAERGRVLGMG